jgi:hypothetical protein
MADRGYSVAIGEMAAQQADIRPMVTDCLDGPGQTPAYCRHPKSGADQHGYQRFHEDHVVVAEHDARHVAPTGWPARVHLPSIATIPTSPLHLFARKSLVLVRAQDQNTRHSAVG